MGIQLEGNHATLIMQTMRRAAVVAATALALAAEAGTSPPTGPEVLAAGGMPAADAAPVYFKAPNPVAGPRRAGQGLGRRFGRGLALSADGGLLAIGETGDGGSARGAFTAGWPGWFEALASAPAPLNGGQLGAVYVHRLGPAGRWGLEAYIKAPNAAYTDGSFGASLALSAAGDILAVSGANEGGSSATAAFHPDDPGYRQMLAAQRGVGECPPQRCYGPAAHVYRRAAGRWALEAYFKTPYSGAAEVNAPELALSADGELLVVGAYWEGSAATGVFHPGDPGFRAAARDARDSGSDGAVYAYRRGAAGRWALEAYLKAPDARDETYVFGGTFGGTLALSANGERLAVGASWQDSAATGVFHPGDAGYAAALASDGVERSGAVYAYGRDADGRWALEAYIKAPNAGAGDWFGSTLALSADGELLAVGAGGESSSATGAFRPGDAGYAAALASAGAKGSGAVYTYRRDADGRWALETYLKAPSASEGDGFGGEIVLSAGGERLTVGATGESSSATGAFRPGDASYAAALASDGAERSGAVYAYRRGAAGRWALEAYLKAPNAGEEDWFGSTLALSADGELLAVSASEEDSSATGVFHPGDAGYAAALASDGAESSGAEDSGAVYVYPQLP